LKKSWPILPHFFGALAAVGSWQEITATFVVSGSAASLAGNRRSGGGMDLSIKYL
jgi:hypothetical protein